MSCPQKSTWVFCQIGAREHYVLASEFARQRRLDALVTDLWVPPGSAMALLSMLAGDGGRALRDRYREDLLGAYILTPGLADMTIDILARLRQRHTATWDRTHRVNKHLGKAFAAALRRKGVLGKPERQVVFAYSYAALEVLTEARRQGAGTILGQIDPGPGEMRLVEAVAARHGLTTADSRLPSHAYWDRWRAECDLADRIVVNSNWSHDLLLGEGIPHEKINIVPLAYEKPAPEFRTKQDPVYDNFKTKELSCLFLGQVTVRKGVIELLGAMEQLRDCHVSLTFVGKIETRLEPLIARGVPKNVHLLGQIPRSQVDACYQAADILVIPTHSDGFAMTQLEAMAHGLPLIASRQCGSVVRDGIDGYVLHEVTPEAIATAIRWFYERPDKIKDMRHAARLRVRDFSSARVAVLLDEVAQGIKR